MTTGPPQGGRYVKEKGMNFDKALSIGSAIVTVALVTTIVSHPTSAEVIRAIGTAFSGALRAAMGK